jgi:nucleotide-binding universal stress UspA family protein
MRFDLSAQNEADELRDWRSKRFRILVCVDGSEESYVGLRFAAEIGQSDECDIILAYVRPADQGLRTGGLQLRVARENMLDWGLELPSVKYLKQGFELLMEVGHLEEEWDAVHTHTDVWGDPLGDNKIEYRHENGKSIVLKLKTAPDVVSGILDQYELGPYNLMTLGEPSRWQGEIRSFWDAGVAQKVAMLSPCSVLVAREGAQRSGYLICTDGSEQSLDAARRAAVLARYCDSPITLFSVTPDHEGQPRAEEVVARAKAMLEESGIPIAGTAVGVGDPVDQIVEAGAGHAVIVVSDSGKSRLKRFLVGSVAFGVMGRAKTSVLNVR